jgi:hypothetical protein
MAAKTFLTLADYLDDIVRFGRNRAAGVMRNMPDIQWSGSTPPRMLSVDYADYGPNVERVWSLLDFIEQAPDDALRIAARTRPRVMRSISNHPALYSGKIGVQDLVPGDLYAPTQSSVLRKEVTGASDEHIAVKQIYAKLAELAGPEGARVQQAKNAEGLASNLWRERLGAMRDINPESYQRAAGTALAESAADVTQGFPQAYSTLTMPLETGLRAAQVGSLYGPDYLQGLETLSSRRPDILNPARVIRLSEAGGLNPDIVNRAISNIIARNEPIRGVSIQDEIFKLLGREDLVSPVDYNRLVNAEKAARVRTREATLRRAQQSAAGTTPAERQLNRILDQVLTPEEKAGIEYLSPEQFGEFVQKVIRERLPDLGKFDG